MKIQLSLKKKNVQSNLQQKPILTKTIRLIWTQACINESQLFAQLLYITTVIATWVDFSLLKKQLI